MGYKGFTLIELIIVVSIVSTLLVLTLPSYQRQLINTRRSMGVAELLDVVIRQEQYFIDYKQYAETLSSLGFLTSPYAISPDGEAVSVLAESRVYLIDLTTSEYGYTMSYCFNVTSRCAVAPALGYYPANSKLCTQQRLKAKRLPKEPLLKVGSLASQRIARVD